MTVLEQVVIACLRTNLKQIISSHEMLTFHWKKKGNDISNIHRKFQDHTCKQELCFQNGDFKYYKLQFTGIFNGRVVTITTPLPSDFDSLNYSWEEGMIIHTFFFFFLAKWPQRMGNDYLCLVNLGVLPYYCFMNW